MLPKPDHISTPLSPWGILGTILSPFLIIIGLIGAIPFLSSLIHPLDSGFFQLLIALLYSIFFLAIAAGGTTWLLRSLLIIHIKPEGIDITLFGKPFRSYPADRLQTFCLLQRGLSKSQSTHLCICTKSIEELAEPREEQFRKDPTIRPKVPRRSIPQTRQEAFAEEFLRKEIKSILWHIPQKDLFWLSFDLDDMAILSLMYPHVRWLIAPESQTTAPICSEDLDPTTVIFPAEKQKLYFHTDRIHVLKGTKEKILMQASDIQSIIRLDCLDGGGAYYRTVLVLSRHSIDELLQSREKMIDAPRLAVLRRLPGWRQLAVRYASKLPSPAVSHWNQHCVVVPWFPRREEALRNLYPQAAWMDCTNNTLFDLIYHPSQP